MSQQLTVFSQVELYLKKNKFHSALKELSIISNKYSKDLIYLNLLKETLIGIGDLSALIITLKQIVKFHCTIKAEFELMEHLYKNGQINEALDIGLSLQEKNLSVLEQRRLTYVLVKIYIEENDFDGVQDALDKSSSLFSIQLENEDFFMWASGLVSLFKQNQEEALGKFRQAVNINPRNDQVWVSLAMLHNQMGDIELAIANLESALDCNPFNHAAVKLYSQWTLKQVDKTQSVLRSLQFYLAENDFDEEMSLCHLQVLCHSKSWSLARQEMDKLIYTFPKNINYQEMKKNLELSSIL